MKDIAGSMNFDTKMDTSGLDKGVNEVKGKGKELGGVLTVALGNLLSSLTEMTIEGLSAIAEAGVRYNAEIEKYQAALTTLTKDAGEANRIIEQIKKDAATTPFDVKGLVQANQLLISAGVSSEQAREDILNLGNAVAATGGGNEELARMAVNLQQIKNVGKASAMDIRQFAFAGIDVYGLLAESMNITREAATEMDVTYEDLTRALAIAASEGGRFEGALANQAKTFNGQVSNLKDNLQSFMGDAAKPLFDLLRDGVLPVINDIIQGDADISDSVPKLMNQIMEFSGMVLMKLLDMLPQFIDAGVKIIISLIQGIARQLPTLIPKIVEVALAIVDTLIDNIDLLIEAGIELIIGLAGGLIQALPLLIEKVPVLIGKLVEELTKPEMLGQLVSAAITLIIAMALGLIQAIPELLKVIPTIIKSIWAALKKNVTETDWKQLGTDILNGIVNGLTKFGSTISNAAKKIYNEIKSKIVSFFKIGSPSKAMRDEVGQWIPKGIAVGIEANTDSVDEAIDEMNDDIMNRMTEAVNVEVGKVAYSGTNGTVSQIMSAFGTTQVTNYNKLYLDGDEVYENQQVVSAKKNLQTQFGGGYSVSS